MASRTGRMKLPRCQAMLRHSMFARQFGEWKAITDKIHILIPRITADEKLEQEETHINNPKCEDY
jgi:hypothetical protein